MVGPSNSLEEQAVKNISSYNSEGIRGEGLSVTHPELQSWELNEPDKELINPISGMTPIDHPSEIQWFNRI